MAIVKDRSKAIAIIPARGGSKGVPRKNLVDLGGIPLVAWSIQAAMQASEISKVFVTTDDEEIAETSRKWGADVPFLRPKDIAGDTAVIKHAVEHVLQSLDQRGETYGIVVLMYPTNPFRTPQLLNQAVKDCRTKTNSVVTVNHFYWNPGFWLGNQNNSWRTIHTSNGGWLYRTAVLFHTFVRHPEEMQSLQGVERLKATMSRYHNGDKRVISGGKYYKICDPVMAVDIDSFEDLEQARKYVKEGNIPWAPEEINKSNRHPSTQLSRTTEQTHKTKVTIYIHNGETKDLNKKSETSIEISSIPNPFELRQRIDELPSLNQKPAIISIDPLINTNDINPDHCLIYLDKNNQFSVGTQQVKHAIEYGGICISSQHKNDLKYSFGALNITQQELKVTVTLSENPMRGDEIRIVLNQTPNKNKNTTVVSSDCAHFNGINWSFKKKFSRIRHHLPLSICGEGRCVSFTCPENTLVCDIQWIRDGFAPNNNYLEICDPIEVDEFISYDANIKTWINTLNNTPIHGRQSLPPIYKWAGRAFLPSKVSENDTWEAVFIKTDKHTSSSY